MFGPSKTSKSADTEEACLLAFENQPKGMAEVLPMGYLMGRRQQDQPAGGVVVDGVVINGAVNGMMMVEGVIESMVVIKDLMVGVMINGATVGVIKAPPPLGSKTPSLWVISGPHGRTICQHLDWQ